jgi:hypothetical protein
MLIQRQLLHHILRHIQENGFKSVDLNASDVKLEMGDVLLFYGRGKLLHAAVYADGHFVFEDFDMWKDSLVGFSRLGLMARVRLGMVGIEEVRVLRKRDSSKDSP